MVQLKRSEYCVYYQRLGRNMSKEMRELLKDTRERERVFERNEKRHMGRDLGYVSLNLLFLYKLRLIQYVEFLNV